MDMIPQFAQPLAPYIKTREETLRIRRTLTLYLLSQVTFVDDEPTSSCHLSASSAHKVDSVKDIPPELANGIRAQYLKALQANVAARKEYNNALQDLATLKEEKHRSSAQDGSLSRGGELQAYLSLLRARQERERMQLFHRYLEKLGNMEAAQPDYLTSGVEWDKISLPSRNPDAVSGGDPEISTDEGVEAVIHDLERAVLRAKHLLNNERKKRDDVKAQMSLSEGRANASGIDAGVRLAALSRVRDELVQWVEERLATTATDDPGAPQGTLTDIVSEDPSSSLEDKKTQIKEQYTAYLAARQALVDAVSTASCPLPANDSRTNIRNEPSTESDQESSTDPTVILPYACRNLLPLSKAQKAATIQQSYLSAMMEKEKWTTYKVLERLQEESHLLPEYPIFTKQARLKNAVASINRRQSSLGRLSSEQNPTSETVEHAKAWAFASAAAGHAINDYVEEKVALGTDLARGAEDTLKELYGTMNRDYVEATAKTDGTSQAKDEDFWASEPTATKNRRSIGRSGQIERQVKGPWSDLNGEVGVIGNG